MKVRSGKVGWKINRKVTDDTPIWFGRYKGTKMKDLPTEYKEWLSKNSFRMIKHYFTNK